jgi:hypothetical protein
LVLELAHLALGFKNPAFVAENEWRLAVSTLGTGCEVAEFAIGAGRINPFVELKSNRPQLPIDEVVILPSRLPDQALKAAQLVMERYKYSPNLVSLSEIPFVT